MNAKSKDLKEEWVDPDDAPELTDEWFDKATLMIGGKPVSREAAKAAFSETVKRGRPKAVLGKVALTVRYDADVVDAFKSTGKGWQTRMNAALKDWLKTHSPA